MAKTVIRCAGCKVQELLEGSVCLSGTWLQGSCRESDLSSHKSAVKRGRTSSCPCSQSNEVQTIHTLR